MFETLLSLIHLDVEQTLQCTWGCQKRSLYSEQQTQLQGGRLEIYFFKLLLLFSFLQYWDLT